MNHSLFISDLHLSNERPAITEAFLAFLTHTAPLADALYILGDLFEYWVGDDAVAHGEQGSVISGLKQLSERIQIYFLAGNRDFLIGKSFALASGTQLLPDPSTLTLYGKRVLLSHGDQLCTDDQAYQAFRNQVRTPHWQASFLQQPYARRMRFVADARAQSEQAKSTKSVEIMDVNPQATDAFIAEHGVPDLFIHGHTHRPNVHLHYIGGRRCERYVLGDWYEQGSYLWLDAQGCKHLALS